MKSENKTFKTEELQKIDGANDLKIAPFREDGKTDDGTKPLFNKKRDVSTLPE